MRTITLIVVHCSAVRPDQTSSAAQIDTWHRQRGFHLGIGYHYVVRRNGEVEAGRPEYMVGAHCKNHTFPYMDVHNDTAIFEHEATTSKISEDQLFYCNQRGIPTEQAVGLIVNGYAKEVLQKLPMEFAVEAQKLLQVSLEGSVG